MMVIRQHIRNVHIQTSRLFRSTLSTANRRFIPIVVIVGKEVVYALVANYSSRN